MTHYGITREQVISALERTNGNVCRAERLFGYAPRHGRSLRERMRHLGLRRSVTPENILVVESVNN